jgi:rhodanese-related sulfurtransferase
MKELNRTNRLTIASLILVALIVVGFFTFRENKPEFALSPENSLRIITSNPGLVSSTDVVRIASAAEPEYLLVDLRNPTAYAKSHFTGAVNIPLADLLTSENIEMLKTDAGVTGKILLIGDEADQANSAWVMLVQMGFDAVYMMAGPYTVNGPGQASDRIDYQTVMESMQDPSASGEAIKPAPVSIPLIKKEKKSKAEGGC